MKSSNNELKPNSVNGTTVTDSSVALGRPSLGQGETGRHPATDPELGGNQASSVATAEPMTGKKTCSGDQATQAVKTVKTTGNNPKRNNMALNLLTNYDHDLYNSNGNQMDESLSDSLENKMVTNLHHERNVTETRLEKRNKVINMEPFIPTKRKRTESGNRTRIITNQIVGRKQRFVKYFSIKSQSNSNLTRLNLFKIDKEILKACGEVSKISHGENETLSVEVKTKEQGEQLMKMKYLVGEAVTVAPHEYFNRSQGVITSDLLKWYSEDDIVDGLSDIGVIKAFRFTRKTGKGTPEPTATVVLTFNVPNPPDRIRIAAGLYEKVRPYIPLPRRCLNCQMYGHIAKNCRRLNTPICESCGEVRDEAHTPETCEKPIKCYHCKEPHKTSSKACARYKIEKEIIATKVKERLSFKEARTKVLSITPRNNTSYASVVAGTDNNNNHNFNEQRTVNKPTTIYYSSQNKDRNETAFQSSIEDPQQPNENSMLTTPRKMPSLGVTSVTRERMPGERTKQHQEVADSSENVDSYEEAFSHEITSTRETTHIREVTRPQENKKRRYPEKPPDKNKEEIPQSSKNTEKSQFRAQKSFSDPKKEEKKQHKIQIAIGSKRTKWSNK